MSTRPKFNFANYAVRAAYNAYLRTVRLACSAGEERQAAIRAYALALEAQRLRLERQLQPREKTTNHNEGTAQ